MARLGELVEQIRGVSYKPSDLRTSDDNDGVMLLRANNIQDGEIVLNDVLYVSKDKVNKKQYLRKGDILVCTSSGSKDLVGKAAFVADDLPCVFGAFCKVVRPRTDYPKYIGYFFQSPYYRNRISDASAGANINNLRTEHIDDLTINMPPLDEQRKIAAVLDKISDLTAKRRRQLDKLDELVKSRFVEMFGGISNSKKYPYKPVKELTKIVSGGTPNREIADYWEHGTIKWVKTTELQNNIIYETEECITNQGLDNSSAKLVPEGTVLIAMYGQGKTRGMAGYLGVKACTNQACACILPSNNINQKFLWQFFMLSYDNLREMGKGGNQPNLNSNIIKDYLVLYPPMKIQEQFVMFLEQADKSKSTIQRSLSTLETLKNLLCRNIFR